MKSQKNNASTKLGFLYLLFVSAVGIALWLFFNSHPKWDIGGVQRFKEWKIASAFSLLLLVLNFLGYFSLNKKGSRSKVSKFWPILYLITSLGLILPWLYYFSKASSPYDIEITNKSDAVIYSPTIEGNNYQISTGSILPKTKFYQQSIRTKFPKNSTLKWMLSSDKKTTNSENTPNQTTLPERSNSKFKKLEITVNNDTANSIWVK